jgi:hypothetical protein
MCRVQLQQWLPHPVKLTQQDAGEVPGRAPPSPGPLTQRHSRLLLLLLLMFLRYLLLLLL